MLGLPGSGKTTFSKTLQQQLNIPRLSLDEEYSRLGGNLANTKWDITIEAAANQSIKSTLKEIVSQGGSVILDFCPWRIEDRQKYKDYIESIGANSHLYYFDISNNELKRRLVARNMTQSNDTHVVTPEMLEAFTNRFDPPHNEEYELVKD